MTRTVSHSRSMMARPLFERAKYKILLGFLFGFLMTKPLFDGVAGGLVAELVVAAVFIAMLNALRDRRPALETAISLLAIAALTRVIHHMTGSLMLRTVSYAFSFAVVFLTAIEVLRGVLQSRKVSPEVVTGALCVYLLIGTGWAFVYVVLLHFSPDAIHLPLAFKTGNITLSTTQRELTAVLYYSLSAMTTLSFGDAVPASAVARQLAIGECISGQLYLTVLVARLVGFSTSSMVDDE